MNMSILINLIQHENASTESLSKHYESTKDDGITVRFFSSTEKVLKLLKKRSINDNTIEIIILFPPLSVPYLLYFSEILTHTFPRLFIKSA